MSIAMFAVFMQNLGEKNMYNTTQSQKNIVNQCILILTQQLKKLEQARSRPGFAKGGMSTIGSLMDTPLMQPVPSLTSSTIKKHRTSFANGGQISVSNSETWTTWSNVKKGFRWMLKKDAPLKFRWRLDWAMWRWVFSTTMMASSTTMPMARMSPNRVIRLME